MIYRLNIPNPILATTLKEIDRLGSTPVGQQLGEAVGVLKKAYATFMSWSSSISAKR